MKKISVLITIILVLALFASCADKIAGIPEEAGFASRAKYDYEMSNESLSLEASSPKTASDNVDITRNRKIIRTGNLKVYVENFEKASDQIEAIVNQYGGVVANKTFNQYTTSVNGSLTLWVPSEKLLTFVEEMKKVGNVTSERINAEDISDQYFDLEARLNNAKKREVRLLDLLDKSGSLEEILKVEIEMARVREEIEVMEGSMRRWDQMIAYSTVNVEVIQDVHIAKEPVNMWKPLRDALRNIKPVFLSSIESIIRFAAFLLISIVAIIPWLIMLKVLLIIWKSLFSKRWTSWRSRKKEEKQMNQFRKEQEKGKGKKAVKSDET
jgi:hypothetical protein